MMLRFPILLLCLASLPLHAAYITDYIAIGLYESIPKANTPHIGTLHSGDEIKAILEQKGNHAKIELTDGRKGWIGKQYISEQIPAVMELIESRKQVLELTQALEQARASTAEPGAAAQPKAAPANTALKQELGAAYKKLAYLEARLKDKDANAPQFRPDAAATCEQQLENVEAKQLQCQVRLAKYTKDDKDSVAAENEKLREIMQQATALLNLPDTGEVPVMIPASALVTMTQTASGSGSFQLPLPKDDKDGLPGWIYLIFLLALVTGGIAGFAFFDYRSRLRY